MKKKIKMLFVISFLATAFCLTADGQQAAGAGQAKEMHTGRVLSTMDSGGYTYIQFEEDGQQSWVACPVTAVYQGDIIKFYRPMVMKDFYSKTLKRGFDFIFFTGSVEVMAESRASTGGPSIPKGHPEIPGIKRDDKNEISVIPGSIKKIKDGYTVEECYAMKKELAGKDVRVKGIVVKFNTGILDRNWIHIKDGTGTPGTDDLTVTTDINVLVGDTIAISGKMALDKDFGSGYFFPVIIEGATVITE